MTSTKLDCRGIVALYEQHGAALLAYSHSLLQDRSAAEDVLHQVFTNVLERRPSINGEPVHYLYRAVRNTALNYRRSRTREVALSTNGHWLESPPGLQDIGLALQAAIAELPDEQREIVILRVWGQLTFEQAAAALDISPNTAASRYRYALAKLKDTLQPLAER